MKKFKLLLVSVLFVLSSCALLKPKINDKCWKAIPIAIPYTLLVMNQCTGETKQHKLGVLEKIHKEQFEENDKLIKELKEKFRKEFRNEPKNTWKKSYKKGEENA